MALLSAYRAHLSKRGCLTDERLVELCIEKADCSGEYSQQEKQHPRLSWWFSKRETLATHSHETMPSQTMTYTGLFPEYTGLFSAYVGLLLNLL